MNSNLRKKRPDWLFYALAVLIIHILGISFLLLGTGKNTELIGMGILAYTLGLRHAFDVDHIVAIDNTVRKLIQEKKNPVGIGFFFSLGHSTVVFVMTILSIVAIGYMERAIPQLKQLGGIIGTSVSGGFLLFLGIINLYIWFDIYDIFTRIRQGKADQSNLEQLLSARGLINRLIAPLYKFINKSWHVYPVGFLFGLGFDTASEVSLLAISVGAARDTTPLLAVLSFPILFAAGMSFLDTADGVLMCNAYNWAFTSPLKKIYYNLTITGISVVVALFIGIVEITQVITPKLGIDWPLSNWLQNIDLNNFGYMLVVLFLLMWAVSFFIWKWLRLEQST